MSINMELWNKVCKTDPSTTKGAKIGQMKITAICPQSQRKAATEAFGPFGAGWGVKDDKYEFLDFDDKTKLCTYTAKLWYNYSDTDGDIHGEFPIQSNSKVAFVTKSGEGYLKVDDEYAKKVATDALTKGLSMLGFNSDIFEGKFDDSKYVDLRKKEEAAEKAAVVKAAEDPIILEKQKAMVDACKTKAELRTLWPALTLVSAQEYGKVSSAKLPDEPAK